MIKQSPASLSSESRSQSQSLPLSPIQTPSTPIKLTALTTSLLNVITSFIIIINLDLINITLSNFRLTFTDSNYFRYPLLTLFLFQFGIILFQVFSKNTWSTVSYYWFICQTMCQIFFILTFSSNTKSSNSTSLPLLIFILFSSIKLYRSIYHPPPNQNYYYFQRNIISLTTGYFIVTLLVVFGMVTVFEHIIKQQNYARVFFITLPILGLVGQALLEVRRHGEKEQFLGCFGYWIGIMYGILIAAYNYLENQLFTYHQPYYS